MSLKKYKRPSLLDKNEAKEEEALKLASETPNAEASKGGRVKATKRE